MTDHPHAAAQPQCTQTRTRHGHGGSRCTEAHDAIVADGRPTGITRPARTSSRPHDLKTLDHLQCGADTFDALAATGVGLMGWRYAHVPPATSAGARHATAARTTRSRHATQQMAIREGRGDKTPLV